ncbi:MAG: ribonucleoside-diphosphate reductase subunit alpha [Candidatus Gracilibacteria bacterium]|nr:ribonucleoside-diphosphate reductase subunit alpha [Candidatus Gracilibacteria bacterium]
MKNPQIYKRTGQLVSFDASRISSAVQKSVEATEKHQIASPENFARELAAEVTLELEAQFFSREKVPSVEDIQDLVERELVESGNLSVARSYILYRAEHAQKRAEKRIAELEKLEKNLLRVTKRNGKKEKFSTEKLQRTWALAAKGLEKECPFEDLFDIFKITLSDGIKTQNILRQLRKAAVDLVSVDNIHWQTVAGRLYALEFYGEATRNRQLDFSDLYSPEAWLQHFKHYRKRDLYSEKFDEAYTEEDLLAAGKWLDRERDFTYIYSTMLAFDRRYLLNPNNVVHELPQEMYLAVALFLAIPEKKKDRLKVAQQIYEVTSTQKLSLPTPTLLNARTKFHQLSSCFKLNVDDDLRGIYHSIENMAQISKFGGGVGVYLGHIRAKGASIRQTKGASGGVLPWTRVINDTACAVNQLGARLGAISPTLDVWHRDIHDFLHLQTESGDIRRKAFDVFPAISVPDIFMKRVEQDGEWTLFDPHEIFRVTGKRLEDYFDTDFETFYTACEQDDRLEMKETVKAKDLMKLFLKTAVETGMPYVFFRDTVYRTNPNKHVGNIYSTQLCTEICQNTSPSKFIEESLESGSKNTEEVHLKYQPGDTVVCNLASINVAAVHTDAEIKKVFPIAMRVLDNVISLNFYPLREAERTAKKYRPVGLGFMGLAEHLACSGLSYDSEAAREHTDALFEKYAYATLDASVRLSEERGQYELFPDSEWSKGKLFGRPASWFATNAKTDRDWKDLITRIKKNGLRFGYHLAPAPNTSTAGVVGTTAGLLPVYKKFFVETNVIAPTVTVAPKLSQENFWHYKEYPNLDMKDVIDLIARVYKWVDQSVSFEWMMNPARTSPSELYDWYFRAWKADIKTVYYLRSMSGDAHEVCDSCSG